MGNYTSRLPWQRALQEHIDLWRVYQLLYYRQQCGGDAVKIKALKKHNISVMTQKQVVDEDINQQVLELSDGNFSGKFPRFELTVNNPLAVKDSIPGVNLIGHAFPGSVVCFYPGITYCPSHVPLMPNYPTISLDNPYLMATTDGSIIDAKHYQQEEGQYSLGHMVRHPVPDTLPNVMPYTFTATDSFVSTLLPNRYFAINTSHTHSTDHTHSTTIVFIAMRHIKNEELFLNYRLHPDSHPPSWYTSIDNSEDKNRWKKIKHFK